MLIYFKYSKKISRCISIINSSKKLFFSTCEARGQSFKPKIRNEKRSKQKIKINSEISLQTLGTDAFGAPRSLFVNSNKYKFLFNCGEGTRRIANEYNIDIGHLSTIFFTSNSWENVSGVPELQDFLTNNALSHFRAYGPRGLKELMTSYGQLDNKSKLGPQECFELQEEIIDCDGSFKIQALPLISSSGTKTKIQNVNSNILDKRKCILAYICTIPPESGFISTEKLVLAGVPPGPLVQCLKDGSSVTLPDGRVISSQDVSNGAFKETTFIVVEVPDFDFLDSLMSCKAFHRHQGGANCLEDIPEVIVHFTPPEVMIDARYRDWVNSFPPFVCHLVLNKKNTCLGLKSTIEMQMRLNQIHPKVFPLHVNPGIPFGTSEDVIPNQEDLPKPTFTSEYHFHGPTVQSDTALQYHIRPHNQFDSSSCPVICPQQEIEPYFDEESFLSSLNHMKKQFESLKSECGEKEKKFPSVLFLGTGSACSTRTRNASAILINISDESRMLLDCGEGTLGQLVRLVGEEEVHSTLRELQLVYISHHHKDHHLGLPTILLERQNSFKKIDKKPLPLYLLATAPVIKYLQSINSSIPILDNVNLLNNYYFVNVQEDFRSYDQLCDSLNLKQIATTFVRHCRNSFGVAFTHKDGWKIAYSGDCEPSKSLTEIGLNCDLLIHEATFEDGMEEDAIRKKHSTVSQAIKMGRDMKAKNIILNHFSQRYNKIPIVKEELMQNNVGIAFDFMKVTLEDLPYLSYIYPPLKELYYKEFDSASIKSFRKSNLR